MGLAWPQGGEINTERYVIGITAEANIQNRVGHTCKPRVLLMREEHLKLLGELDRSQLEFESRSTNSRVFHGDRFEHLVLLGEHWRRQKHFQMNANGTRDSDTVTRGATPVYCGKVRLSVPMAMLRWAAVVRRWLCISIVTCHLVVCHHSNFQSSAAASASACGRLSSSVSSAVSRHSPCKLHDTDTRCPLPACSAASSKIEGVTWCRNQPGKTTSRPGTGSTESRR